MLKDLFIPTKENNYTPFFSSKGALIIFTLWILVFGSVSSIFIDSHRVHATTLSGDRIVQLANTERRQRGLEPLKTNASLTAAAYAKASNMFSEQYWDHFGPNGESPWQFIRASGYEYSYAGENLGKGFTSSEGLHQAWMASITHRDNIINEHYTEIGVAVVNGTLLNQNITLVVQLFGRPVGRQTNLADAGIVRGEGGGTPASSGIKSIRIVYPEDGEVYNDAQIPIKGDTINIDVNSQVEIFSGDEVLGTAEIQKDLTWEFEKPYDWEQGENEIDAIFEDIKDSVSFFINSIPPKLINIEVEGMGHTYELRIEIDKFPAEVSIISAEDIFNSKITQSQLHLYIPRDKIGDKVLLILSDEYGNVSKEDITEYFAEDSSNSRSSLGFIMNASTVQRTVIIFFAIFIMGILALQFYHYKELGLLQEKEGDLLMLGVWWLILLFGSFVGYSGVIN
jgi:hypothetical protein